MAYKFAVDRIDEPDCDEAYFQPRIKYEIHVLVSPVLLLFLPRTRRGTAEQFKDRLERRVHRGSSSTG